MPELLRDLGFSLKTAHLYGQEPEGDTRPSATEVWAYWLDRFRANIRDDYDNVVLLTGPPGSGKSVLAMRLAMGVDPKGFSPDRVTYTTEELIAATQGSTRGQVVIYDEAVTGLLSTDSFSEETKALVRVINVVRAKGVTFFLCIPDIWDIAKAFRARRADFWLACRRRPRGFAMMHTRDYRTRYEPTTLLPLWAHKTMNPVQWASLEGTKLWADYLRLKHERIDAMLKSERSHLVEGKQRKAANWQSADDLKPRLLDYWRSGQPMGNAAFVLHTSPNRIYPLAQDLGIWHPERPKGERWDKPPSPGTEGAQAPDEVSTGAGAP